MISPHAFTQTHVQALLAEAATEHVDRESVIRALLHTAIGLLKEGRSIDDVANELRFLADNLDDDEDYTFMRP